MIIKIRKYGVAMSCKDCRESFLIGEHQRCGLLRYMDAGGDRYISIHGFYMKEKVPSFCPQKTALELSLVNGECEKVGEFITSANSQLELRVKMVSVLIKRVEELTGIPGHTSEVLDFAEKEALDSLKYRRSIRKEDVVYGLGVYRKRCSRTWAKQIPGYLKVEDANGSMVVGGQGDYLVQEGENRYFLSKRDFEKKYVREG